MNLRFILFSSIYLCEIFDGICASVDVREDLSKSRSPSLGKWFKNIGVRRKMAEKKSAEKKFFEQLQHRSRLIEAAKIKAEKLRKNYENASGVSLTDLVTVKKLALKKGYHKWLKRRARNAESEYDKLTNKYKPDAEEFCEFRRNNDKKSKWKKHKILDICEKAFKHPYFKKEKLTYTGNFPYACQNGIIFITETGTAETIKYDTKFKTCDATKEYEGGSSRVAVFLKKSDKQRRGGKLKFFVIFAYENNPDGTILQKIGNWFIGEDKQYKVEAYLKADWF